MGKVKAIINEDHLLLVFLIIVGTILRLWNLSWKIES